VVVRTGRAADVVGVGWLQPAMVADINATAKIRGVNIGYCLFPGR
jgi:hypothetical protein